MTIEIKGYAFTLLPEKALYKPDERLLIIADVHLGKANHFRKEGISIPAEAQHTDYINLEALLLKTDPLKVYFLGDLFHSAINLDWNYFSELILKFPAISFTLLKGNHDIIDHRLFGVLNISVIDTIDDGVFYYTHEPLDQPYKDRVNIAGHIHPGVVLTGMGRQSLKLPCFYTTEHAVVLPAFGILTGLYSINATDTTAIFAVVPGGIKKISRKR